MMEICAGLLFIVFVKSDFPSLPKIVIHTVNLLYMKFSASVKKGLHQISDKCFLHILIHISTTYYIHISIT